MTSAAIGDAMSASAVIRLAAAQFAAFCALLLIASAAHKMRSADEARRAAGELAGVSLRRAALLVLAAALAEMSAGCLLLIPATRAAGAALAAAIWALYGAALGLAFARGRTDLHCGCSFAVADRPIGVYQPSRALGLAALAGGVALAGRGASASVSIWMMQLLAAAAMLGLYLALDQAMALRPLRAGVVQ